MPIVEAEQMRRAAHALDTAEVGDLVAPDAEAEGDAEAGPGERDEERYPERRVGGAALQRVEEVADRADIVVGGAPRAGPLVRFAICRGTVSILARIGGFVGRRIVPRRVGAPVPVAILFTFCATPAADGLLPPLKSIFSASSTAWRADSVVSDFRNLLMYHTPRPYTEHIGRAAANSGRRRHS